MIYVTGRLGDADAALQLRLNQLTDNKLNDQDKAYLQQRLEQPTPRNEIGQAIVGVASAAIDISDGLVADLGHILDNSHVGARLNLDRLPLSSAIAKISKQEALFLALQSGDDYELCFTVPPQHFAKMQQQFQDQCTRIGMITDDDGLFYLNDKNKLIDLTKTGSGYDHFK